MPWLYRFEDTRVTLALVYVIRRLYSERSGRASCVALTFIFARTKRVIVFGRAWFPNKAKPAAIV